MDFRASSLVNFLIFMYLQSLFLLIYAISLLKVVEKYHDIIKTYYLQNVQIRRIRIITIKERPNAPSETDSNLK